MVRVSYLILGGTVENKKEIPMYVITWGDANANAGWFDFDLIESENLNTASIVHSLGFLLHETPDTILLAQGICEDGAMLNYSCIPKKWILKKKRLR